MTYAQEFKRRRTLTFDPAKETFPGDVEADALLTRKYRQPYPVAADV